MIGFSWNRPTTFAAWIVMCGCTEGSAVGAQTLSDGGAPIDGATTIQLASTQPAKPAQAASPTPGTRIPVELLGLTVTSAVQKKEPVDKLTSVTAGSRVYAHLKMRNRSTETRTIHVDFIINGKLRTPLKLDIDPSWSFRTWGYNTLQTNDSGELEVHVYDDGGTVLETVRLPIRPK